MVLGTAAVTAQAAAIALRPTAWAPATWAARGHPAPSAAAAATEAAVPAPAAAGDTQAWDPAATAAECHAAADFAEEEADVASREVKK